MALEELSPGQRQRAQRSFYLFVVLNVVSFTLLGENVISLFALRLGAESFLIGLLASALYLAYFFMLIGRLLASRLGMVGLMGRFWVLRYLLMIPILFSPLFALQGKQEIALSLIVISVFGFHLSRGIAITGYNPIVGEIAGEQERGSFLARLQVLNHSGGLAAGLLMAWVLGQTAPLYVYSIFMGAGILFGFTGSYTLFRLPEPKSSRGSFSQNLLSGFRHALGRKSFRRFITVQFLTFLAAFLVAPFLVVYLRQVYQQGDSRIILFTVMGNLGAISMALISGFMIDRLGAKPLLFIFAGILTLTLIPMVLAPALPSPLIGFIFAAAIFFFNSMGRSGVLNAGQTYFFSIIDPQERLNLGIVFFLTQGLAGVLGSLIGGTLLTGLRDLLMGNSRQVFQIYFGLVATLSLLILYLITTMENIGAYPIRDVLAIIFSPRDLRAISLLHRLKKSTSLSEEKSTLRAIAENPSELSVREVLQRLSSPRFTIRAEALMALDHLPVDGAVAQALISEVKNHQFTTAYLAAEILGKKRIAGGIRALRKGLGSQDFFLSGKCMVALARLNDRASIPRIEGIIRQTENPRLIIHGAAALEMFKSSGALPSLLAKLEKGGAPFLRDEIILSLAGILGMEGWFYPYYAAFLQKSTTGISMLKDFLADPSPNYRAPDRMSSDPSPNYRAPDRMEELLDSILRKRSSFTALAQELVGQAEIVLDNSDVSALWCGAVANPHLIRLDRFRFLVAAIIIWFTCRSSEGDPSSPAGA